MLVIGAKGFAKEVLEVLHQLSQLKDLAFYDDISADIPSEIYNKFPVLKNMKEVMEYLQQVDKRFTIAIGNPALRRKMYNKFTAAGAQFVSTVSPSANIGSYDVVVGEGSNILHGAVLSNGVVLGKGCIVYYNSVITHDCKIGDFVEVSPGVVISGRCTIGSYSQIGAGAIILPDVQLEQNVVVGAGAVVTKKIPANSLVVGVPAVVIKNLTPLSF